MEGQRVAVVGAVTGEGPVKVTRMGQRVLELSLGELKKAWQTFPGEAGKGTEK